MKEEKKNRTMDRKQNMKGSNDRRKLLMERMKKEWKKYKN